MHTENKETDIKNRSLCIATTINAPVDRIWQAWTQPDQIAQWWGPEGFTTDIVKMIVEEGEEWKLTLIGPDGQRFPNKSIYRQVIKNKKIVYGHFNPDFVATVDFTTDGDKTILEWCSVFPTKELFDIVVNTFKADEGMKQNVEKLKRFLEPNR